MECCCPSWSRDERPVCVGDRSGSVCPIADEARSKERRARGFLFLNIAAMAGFLVGPMFVGMIFAECTLVMFTARAIVFSPLVKPEATRWLFTPGLAVLAIGLAVTPFTAGFAAMATAVGLVAASAGILSPIAAYWISLGGGATQGEEIGRQTAATSFGQVVGSAVGGLLSGVVVVPGASFTLTAGVVLAGVVASVGLPRRLPTPQHTAMGPRRL